MPVYEFRCNDCGINFEEYVKINGHTDVRCPICKSNNAQKQVSYCAFHLKGDGWAKDSYSKKVNR